MDALFAALGAGFATGLGVLVLIAIAGLIVVAWDWRLALVGVFLLQVGSSILLVQVHQVPGVIVGGQLVATVLSLAMLALAATSTPAGGAVRQAANWPLRLAALLFVVGAWWFIDPGYTLPLFTRAETRLLIWMAICGLALAAFASNPIINGVALLLWCITVYAVAAVLLPGSGLAVMVGIVELLLALACGYLALLEPAGATDPSWRKSFPLPQRNAPRIAWRTRAFIGGGKLSAYWLPGRVPAQIAGSERRLEKPAKQVTQTIPKIVPEIPPEVPPEVPPEISPRQAPEDIAEKPA